MSNFTGIVVVIVAIACMYLAQRKTTPKPTRCTYSVLGSIASVMIAIEAARRGEMGVMTLFVGAAAFSAIGTVLDYLKPTKPDA